MSLESILTDKMEEFTLGIPGAIYIPLNSVQHRRLFDM
jgi:hypothetical protein